LFFIFFEEEEVDRVERPSNGSLHSLTSRFLSSPYSCIFHLEGGGGGGLVVEGETGEGSFYHFSILLLLSPLKRKNDKLKNLHRMVYH
jgi:hypothetical protein